jgi:hypothetical protein
MLERALEATTDQPGVERIVAVLDENGALCESQERSPRISELGGADEHRAIDVVTLAGVRVDGRATIHQRVEEGEWPIETESLGSQLEDKEWRIACRLDVDGDELSVLQPSLGR